MLPSNFHCCYTSYYWPLVPLQNSTFQVWALFLVSCHFPFHCFTLHISTTFCLKEQCHEIFDFIFFMNHLSTAPLIILVAPFRTYRKFANNFEVNFRKKIAVMLKELEGSLRNDDPFNKRDVSSSLK
jgi:hypothetical protein